MGCPRKERNTSFLAWKGGLCGKKKLGFVPKAFGSGGVFVYFLPKQKVKTEKSESIYG
ncbi:MAG: hypothetical protein SFY32_07585 [Bacteroidota bacterium]|nr:hypothetical protein [Bacteroidota bacterium]